MIAPAKLSVAPLLFVRAIAEAWIATRFSSDDLEKAYRADSNLPIDKKTASEGKTIFRLTIDDVVWGTTHSFESSGPLGGRGHEGSSRLVPPPKAGQQHGFWQYCASDHRNSRAAFDAWLLSDGDVPG